MYYFLFLSSKLIAQFNPSGKCCGASQLLKNNMGDRRQHYLDAKFPEVVGRLPIRSSHSIQQFLPQRSSGRELWEKLLHRGAKIDSLV